MNENTREQIDYNVIVARQDGEYITLDYVFKHSDDFKGATGTRSRTLYSDNARDVIMY